MLLSSDQQALLRTWFFHAQKIHKRLRRYDVLNLPGRCGLEDARWLSGVLEQVFQAVAARDRADSEESLKPYLHHVGSWVRAYLRSVDPAGPGNKGRHKRAEDVSTAARAFVHTLGSLEVQSYNESNPMNDRLPADVFILIFELLAFKDLLAASHVCHHWRRIALASPSLWTALELYETDFGTDVCLGRPELSRLIQRSNAAPLSLLVANLRRQSMDTLSACLSTSLSRIQWLSVTFSSDVLFSNTWLDALRQPAPVLEYLRLASGRRRRHDKVDCMIQIPGDLFMGHAPRLRAVYLGTLNLPHSCPALAQVRGFAGHFAESRNPALAQGRQTSLVYRLCPLLETLDLCWIGRDGGVIPPPTGLALKSVTMNSELVDKPGYLSEDIHRAVSGIGDVSGAQFARAISGDTDAVMRLWCDPLPPWRTVTIEQVQVNNSLSAPTPPMIIIGVQCGLVGSPLKTREFALATSYLRNDYALVDQMRARMAPVHTCIIDPRVFGHCMQVNILQDATALEELHVVLDDDYERTLRLFARSEIVLRLPALKKLKFCAPSEWVWMDCSTERTVRVQAANLAAFLNRHVKAPNLTSLALARDLNVKEAGDLSHGLPNFVGSVVVE